jgi:hypothetical protein
MTVSAAFDVAGRRRSPATLPGYHAGRAPRNKGQRYPADPPTVDEIVAVMRQTAEGRHGARPRRARATLMLGHRFEVQCERHEESTRPADRARTSSIPTVR